MNAMHGKFRSFSLGKLSSHCTALPSVFSPLCAVFLCFYNTGCGAYSFTTDGYGIFNKRTHLGVCHTHEGGSGTNKSAKELTRSDRKTVPHPAPYSFSTQILHHYQECLKRAVGNQYNITPKIPCAPQWRKLVMEK